MADSIINGVRILGIGRAVPEGTASFDDYAETFQMDPAQAARMKKTLGLGTRSLALAGETSAQLCQAAATSLLTTLNQDPSEIDLVINVTQTAEYRQPSDSCLIHGRLGLSMNCACLDVNLGCSGYIYGLWQAHCAIAGGGMKKVLLLAGDTVSRQVHPGDRAVAPLFGDGGSATLLTVDPQPSTSAFVLRSDGSGWKALNVPAGGFKRPSDSETCLAVTYPDGSTRSLDNLHMDGGAVMSFTLREVPPLLKKACELMNWSVCDPDAFILHQANAFILSSIAKMTSIPIAKVPSDSFTRYGNLSSASIPFALAHALETENSENERKNLSGLAEIRPLSVVLAGFGVGLSWGAAALQLTELICPETVILKTIGNGQ
ncbi:MAG: 3-oxoacyl-ACP synthase [Candidatus Wallbacteria bacterium HGW-Wallbacteria-1]|jgi:3-oxoacyl-[acyl-carrier-protein] synthase-3|uniref:3-oxoacyl-ACP synthase n=1 Tax=Candidatus Wallbacteria bacterium HGW-Wallbacteria-1 TaxID=2013854 RepID=A0A2N1PMD3_9BACT|nr:MAG: 3-oxoacyl-ACP synthase [Candidatus Wallbacteria bacterium HGW-Wallbacteria-1]